jgi:transposase
VGGRAERPSHYVQLDFGRIHQELGREGMTRMLLWKEYVAQHPQQSTWRYSQFCENYRRYALRLKRSMRQIHRAGETVFIDYACPTVELTDGSRAHIFVAALGASSYTFACATPRETMADWLHGCSRALSFFGGVPQLIVPDNPRAVISNPNRYEPRTNDTVVDFARHHGTSVLPVRPRHPQDKARAESAVQVVQRRILMRLRNQRFTSVDDLNEAMAPLLDRLNSKPFQRLPGSRASTFADLDAPALQQLRLQPWEFAVFRTVRVHIDHHVEVDGHRYSVSQALVSQLIEARITAHAVELLHRGQRVAAHARSAHKGGFTTVVEHLPAAHRVHLQWTPERLIRWGQSIGVATGRTVWSACCSSGATPSTATEPVWVCHRSRAGTESRGWRRPVWSRWSWVRPSTTMCATSWPMAAIRSNDQSRPNGSVRITPMCAGRATTSDGTVRHPIDRDREQTHDDEHHLGTTARPQAQWHGRRTARSTQQRRHERPEL